MERVSYGLKVIDDDAMQCNAAIGNIGPYLSHPRLFQTRKPDFRRP